MSGERQATTYASRPMVATAISPIRPPVRASTVPAGTRFHLLADNGGVVPWLRHGAAGRSYRSKPTKVSLGVLAIPQNLSHPLVRDPEKVGGVALG